MTLRRLLLSRWFRLRGKKKPIVCLIFYLLWLLRLVYFTLRVYWNIRSSLSYYLAVNSCIFYSSANRKSIDLSNVRWSRFLIVKIKVIVVSYWHIQGFLQLLWIIIIKSVAGIISCLHILILLKASASFTLIWYGVTLVWECASWVELMHAQIIISWCRRNLNEYMHRLLPTRKRTLNI